VEVYGLIPPEVEEKLQGIPLLKLMGPVSHNQMPSIFKRRSIYLSLKTNHSCPNVVLEALASGVPVVGFDTGSLPELVSSEAGCIVPYGANPWLLESPDVEGLYRAIGKVAQRLDEYRMAARSLAEQRFSIKTMAAAYMAVFQDVVMR
jgi:glycosyltransferase involved in cell wall biosynthesis